MVTRYKNLEFDHLVIFEKDDTIFAAARENGSGHLRLFLIHQNSGNIYTRNGRADSWEELFGDEHADILNRVTLACNNHVPVYHINGKHNA